MTGGLSGSLEGNDILSQYTAMTGHPATFLNILHYIFIEKYILLIIIGVIGLWIILKRIWFSEEKGE
jgi:hypothetical protein